MNGVSAYKKLEELSESDLILFRANLHPGHVPIPIWEVRMGIIRNLIESVNFIAERKEFDIPSEVNLMETSSKEDLINPDRNLQRYLGVS